MQKRNGYVRSIDIVNELKEYGINPVVADPQADAEEAYISEGEDT